MNGVREVGPRQGKEEDGGTGQVGGWAVKHAYGLDRSTRTLLFNIGVGIPVRSQQLKETKQVEEPWTGAPPGKRGTSGVPLPVPGDGVPVLLWFLQWR